MDDLKTGGQTPTFDGIRDQWHDVIVFDELHKNLFQMGEWMEKKLAEAEARLAAHAADRAMLETRLAKAKLVSEDQRNGLMSFSVVIRDLKAELHQMCRERDAAMDMRDSWARRAEAAEAELQKLRDDVAYQALMKGETHL